jgi:UTP--glucose-1-phosphate uridylyltransferase
MVARFNETGRSQVLAKRMPGDLSEYSVIQTKDGLKVEGGLARTWLRPVSLKRATIAARL